MSTSPSPFWTDPREWSPTRPPHTLAPGGRSHQCLQGITCGAFPLFPEANPLHSANSDLQCRAGPQQIQYFEKATMRGRVKNDWLD